MNIYSLHNCPLCLDQISRNDIIFYHRANRSSLASKIAKVFHAFHEKCLQEAQRHGHSSCPVCKEEHPDYQYAVANAMYQDERLSQAWEEKNFENAKKILADMPQDIILNHLKEAAWNCEFEMVECILESHPPAALVFEGLVDRAIYIQNNDELLKWLVKSNKLSIKSLERVHDFYPELIKNICKHCLTQKVAMIAKCVFAGFFLSGAFFSGVMGYKWLGAGLMLSSPFVAFGSGHLAKRHFLY